MEEHASLRTWRQTLQIWTPKGEDNKTLIEQVSYVLDPGFARRYSCLLPPTHDNFYDAALDGWHAKFSRRLRETLFLEHALKRATSDRTTVHRASYDKAFDLTTASHPQAFPCTVMLVRISDDLASMLEAHPMLPCQSAGGMTALTAQTFVDQVMRITAKGPQRQRAPERVSPQPKPETSARILGTPKWERAAAGEPRIKGWSQNSSGWTGYSKAKQGNDKAWAEGNWKDRDHDRRTIWKKDDDEDNNDSWGSNRGYGPLPGPLQAVSLEAPTKVPINSNSPRTPKAKVMLISSPSLCVLPVPVPLGAVLIAPHAKIIQYPPGSCGRTRFHGSLSSALHW